MYSFTDTCILCLVHGKNNTSISSEDGDGILVEHKLKYVISELANFKLELVPKNICTDCLTDINYLYKFKQKSLQNLICLSDYINKITVKNSDNNYFILIHNNSTNALDTNSEINDKKLQPENQLLPANNVKESIVEIKTELEDTHDIDIKESSFLFDEMQTKLLEKEYKDVVTNEKSRFTSEENNQMSALTDDGSSIDKQLESNQICYNIEMTHKPLLPETTNTLQSASTDSDNTSTSIISECNKKTHTCSECQETFTKKKKLTSHIRKHLSEKPHTCEICDKRFSFKKNLKEHLVTHNGNKPFKCDMCEKTFINEIRLINHKHKHTGKKQFKCDICEKEFSYETSLLYHKRAHIDSDKPMKRAWRKCSH